MLQCCSGDEMGLVWPGIKKKKEKHRTVKRQCSSIPQVNKFMRWHWILKLSMSLGWHPAQIWALDSAPRGVKGPGLGRVTPCSAGRLAAGSGDDADAQGYGQGTGRGWRNRAEYYGTGDGDSKAWVGLYCWRCVVQSRTSYEWL